jgi:hypothetical protein
MFGNKASLTQTNDHKAPALKKEGTTFAPKAKGSVLNTTPVVDPALRALAFNRRKKVKLG